MGVHKSVRKSIRLKPYLRMDLEAFEVISNASMAGHQVMATLSPEIVKKLENLGASHVALRELDSKWRAFQGPWFRDLNAGRRVPPIRFFEAERLNLAWCFVLYTLIVLGITFTALARLGTTFTDLEGEILSRPRGSLGSCVPIGPDDMSVRMLRTGAPFLVPG